jgi:hypothetical protein
MNAATGGVSASGMAFNNVNSGSMGGIPPQPQNNIGGENNTNFDGSILHQQVSTPEAQQQRETTQPLPPQVPLPPSAFNSPTNSTVHNPHSASPPISLNENQSSNKPVHLISPRDRENYRDSVSPASITNVAVSSNNNPDFIGDKAFFATQHVSDPSASTLYVHHAILNEL